MSENARLGLTHGHDVNTSPNYLIFRRGSVPTPTAVPQRSHGVRFTIDPTPDSLMLRCGGLHVETDVLLPGELQQPLGASAEGIELFQLFCWHVFRSFVRIRLYWLGPGALRRLRAGQRLATISLASPREYDLSEP